MMQFTSTNWQMLHSDAFTGQRVLITGGAGFIGSHLSRALSSLGAEVIVIDDLSGGVAENLSGVKNVELVEASILDFTLLSRCARGCKNVFHLAAKGSVPRSVLEPRLYCEVNIGGTLNVLEAARDAGASRVIYSASSSAYGESPTLPKHELMPPRPCSPYAATKLAGEALGSAYANSYDMDFVGLRYFNVFGPRQNGNSAYAAVIAAFASALLEGRSPKIFGDGEQSRDFTYVDNVVHANLLAARNPTPLKGAVCNVGCAARITISELAAAMAELLDRPDLTPCYEKERVGDVKHSLADITIAKQVIGYQQIVNFSDGLRKTVQWYQEKFSKQQRSVAFREKEAELIVNDR